jgi:hypothetical protein
MEEAVIAFPFRKLRYDIYLTLDIMMCVERSEVLKYMFGINKETRKFLHHHYISIQN